MFLWIWFKDIPIHSFELYKRLKERGALVVSGHYFFPESEYTSMAEKLLDKKNEFLFF